MCQSNIILQQWHQLFISLDINDPEKNVTEVQLTQELATYNHLDLCIELRKVRKATRSPRLRKKGAANEIQAQWMWLSLKFEIIYLLIVSVKKNKKQMSVHLTVLSLLALIFFCNVQKQPLQELCCFTGTTVQYTSVHRLSQSQ